MKSWFLVQNNTVGANREMASPSKNKLLYDHKNQWSLFFICICALHPYSLLMVKAAPFCFPLLSLLPQHPHFPSYILCSMHKVTCAFYSPIFYCSVHENYRLGVFFFIFFYFSFFLSSLFFSPHFSYLMTEIMPAQNTVSQFFVKWIFHKSASSLQKIGSYWMP